MPSDQQSTELATAIQQLLFFLQTQQTAEKAKQNKILRDRNAEIAESRDQWKNRSKELMRHKEDLEQQIEAVKEEANRERMRAEQLQNEIETIWKKKSRT